MTPKSSESPWPMPPPPKDSPITSALSNGHGGWAPGLEAAVAAAAAPAGAPPSDSHHTPTGGRGEPGGPPGRAQPPATGFSNKWQALNRRRALGMPLGWLLAGGAGLVLIAVVLVAVLVPVLQPSAPEQYAGAPGAPEQKQPLAPAVRGAGAFVKVNDNMQLEVGCRPFYIVGFNAYELTERSMVPGVLPDGINNASGPHNGPTPTLGGQSGRNFIADSLARAASIGLNTVRTWAHTSNEMTPFQVAPGVYDDAGLAALDFVVFTASQLGLRIIFSLVDNWYYYNGVDQYVDWSSTVPERIFERPADRDPANQGGQVVATIAGLMNNTNVSLISNNATSPEEVARAVERYEKQRHALFWTDSTCRSMYRAHILAIASRRNSISGLLYRDDPTIMAWDLVNEPRCEERDGCPELLQAWIEEMSAYVKTVAPSQMVTVGSEGFFGPSTPELWRFNPGTWANDTGQDFVLNNAPDTIDFVTLHAWPDNWGDLGDAPYLPFIESWISSHTNYAAYLNKSTRLPVLRKPVLLEEYGKKLMGANMSEEGIAAWRDPVYATTYDVVQQLIVAAADDAGLTLNQTVPVGPSNADQLNNNSSTLPTLAAGAGVMNQTLPLGPSSARQLNNASSDAPAPGGPGSASQLNDSRNVSPPTDAGGEALNQTVAEGSGSAAELNNTSPAATADPASAEGASNQTTTGGPGSDQEAQQQQQQPSSAPPAIIALPGRKLLQQQQQPQPPQPPLLLPAGSGSGRQKVAAGGERPLPLLGSIFWKWQVPVYSLDADEYGILPNQSTTRLIFQHAQLLNAFSASLGVLRDCKVPVKEVGTANAPCWVGVSFEVKFDPYSVPPPESSGSDATLSQPASPENPKWIHSCVQTSGAACNVTVAALPPAPLPAGAAAINPARAPRQFGSWGECCAPGQGGAFDLGCGPLAVSVP